MPVYDEKYIKAKVREFNGVIKTNFLGDEIPKESMHYTCIACITIDFVKRMEKKNYPQIYLEKCKHKSKKIKMTKFINTESESASELESNSEQLFFYSFFADFGQISHFADFEEVKNLIVILLSTI